MYHSAAPAHAQPNHATVTLHTFCLLAPVSPTAQTAAVTCVQDSRRLKSCAQPYLMAHSAAFLRMYGFGWRSSSRSTSGARSRAISACERHRQPAASLTGADSNSVQHSAPAYLDVFCSKAHDMHQHRLCTQPTSAACQSCTSFNLDFRSSPSAVAAAPFPASSCDAQHSCYCCRCCCGCRLLQLRLHTC